MNIKRNKKNISFMPYILLAVVIVCSYLFLNTLGTKVNTLNYTELVSQINDGNVTEIAVTPRSASGVYVITGKLSNYSKGETFSVTVPYTDTVISSLYETAESKNLKVETNTNPDNATWLNILINVVPIVIFGVLIYVMFIKLGNNGKGTFDFGKSKAKLAEEGNTHKTFKDVAGLKEEKEEVQELIDFLKNPKKFTKMGARIPKGVLLVGPPGTGKTLLAKAVAGEAGVPFYSISGSDFVEMYVGVGASRVRELFGEAKSKGGPCIIFIDEIDAVGRQRGAGLGGGHDEREQTLNQLLVEMDGFGTNSGIIVLAATNRPDILDPALLRPGRFDRQIVVPAPDVKAREEILSLYAKKKKLAGDIDLGVLAKNTAGFTGADLENLMNEAALLAARRDETAISMVDLENAMTKVLMGPEKKSKVIPEKDRKLVAYHEGGHAVVSRFLENSEPVHQISIVPRGMAGGYTMYKNTEDKSFMSKSEMEDKIVSLLGGRVAEQLILNDISTGASNDIERASKIARNMVMRYGMSERLGAITFGNDQEEVFLGRDINNVKNYSDEIAAVIDVEVKNIIDKGYNRAKSILQEHIDKLHKVAAVLLEKEKIEGEEFEAIMKS